MYNHLIAPYILNYIILYSFYFHILNIDPYLTQFVLSCTRVSSFLLIVFGLVYFNVITPPERQLNCCQNIASRPLHTCCAPPALCASHPSSHHIQQFIWGDLGQRYYTLTVHLFKNTCTSCRYLPVCFLHCVKPHDWLISYLQERADVQVFLIKWTVCQTYELIIYYIQCTDKGT